MKKLILSALLFITVLHLKSQPCTTVKEYNRKKHIVSVGSNEKNTYGHPYTMFDKHNGYSFQQTIENIRKRITEEYKDSTLTIEQKPVFRAYKKVYNYAITPKPYDNGMPDDYSNLAVWAKFNAFVMLVGLNGNGDTLSVPQRENFKNSVLHAFNSLKSNVSYLNYFGVEDFNYLKPGNILAISQTLEKLIIQQIVSVHYVKFYSRNLIAWLQAYDMLKASAALPELASIKYYNNYNTDANKDWCSPRNKLRNLTKSLYKMSKGWLGIVEHKWGWKKNHGIAAASALLMAAQVLNDAGVETSYAYELKSIKI